jgi:hypothetical protein
MSRVALFPPLSNAPGPLIRLEGAAADQFAANVLPVIRQIQGSGVTTLTPLWRRR